MSNINQNGHLVFSSGSSPLPHGRLPRAMPLWCLRKGMRGIVRGPTRAGSWHAAHQVTDYLQTFPEDLAGLVQAPILSVICAGLLLPSADAHHSVPSIDAQ